MRCRKLPGVVLLTAVLAAPGLAQVQPLGPKTARPKRVFTNDDLLKYRESNLQPSVPSQASRQADSKIEVGASSSVEASSNVEVLSLSQEPRDGPEAWSAKLKAADKNLETAKFGETKFSASLARYQQKLSEAKTEFQIKTAQTQVADCEKNLARFKEELKKAEEEKRKLLAEAKKNGVEPGQQPATPQ